MLRNAILAIVAVFALATASYAAEVSYVFETPGVT